MSTKGNIIADIMSIPAPNVTELFSLGCDTPSAIAINTPRLNTPIKYSLSNTHKDWIENYFVVENNAIYQKNSNAKEYYL